MTNMKTSDRNQDEILTVEQVADLLQLHPNTVYQRASTGELPGMFRLGEGDRAPIRFYKTLLLEGLAKQATKP